VPCSRAARRTDAATEDHRPPLGPDADEQPRLRDRRRRLPRRPLQRWRRPTSGLAVQPHGKAGGRGSRSAAGGRRPTAGWSSRRIPSMPGSGRESTRQTAIATPPTRSRPPVRSRSSSSRRASSRSGGSSTPHSPTYRCHEEARPRLMKTDRSLTVGRRDSSKKETVGDHRAQQARVT
jgi:hypothetical protein